MCDPVFTPYLIGAAALGTAAQISQAKDANYQQRVATDQATQQAKATADAADQANNRANAKSPDLGAIASATEQAAKGGQSGTLLTGPTGVDTSSLLLGKKTLLGG